MSKMLRIFETSYVHPTQAYPSTTPFHVIPDGRRNLGERRMSRKVGRKGEKNSDSTSAGRKRGRERESADDGEVGDIVAGLL